MKPVRKSEAKLPDSGPKFERWHGSEQYTQFISHPLTAV